MKDDDKFMQEQINDLQICVSRLEALVNGTIESTSRNSEKLEILVRNNHSLRNEINLITRNQLTKEDIAELLEISVNAAIVAGFKKLLWAVILAATGVIVTILTPPFNFK